jgi:hypothetical protein
MIDPALAVVAMLGMVCVTVVATVVAQVHPGQAPPGQTSHGANALAILAKVIAELLKHLK